MRPANDYDYDYRPRQGTPAEPKGLAATAGAKNSAAVTFFHPGWRSRELVRARRLIRAKVRAYIRLDAARHRLVRELEIGGEPETGRAVNAMLDTCISDVDARLARLIDALLDAVPKAPPRRGVSGGQYHRNTIQNEARA